MSKIMTKESRVVLSGRYDQKECRARVVIPEYKLGQCVNITHWRGGDRECLEKALPGHPHLVSAIHEHSHRLARMLCRTDPLWVGPTGEDISSDLATITVAEVGELEGRPIWVAF